MTVVEACAGTASVSLWALGRCAPLTGYMGSKRRWAPLLVGALGVDRPDRVVLCDAGPWGETWETLATAWGRADTAALLRSWNAQDPHELWSRLVEVAPSGGPEGAAQFLWLQARSAGTIPIWWCRERARWESPTGSRTEAAHNRGGAAAWNRGTRDGAAAQKGAGAARKRQKQRAPSPRLLDLALEASWGSRVVEGARQRGPQRSGCRGIQYPETIARRIESLSRIDWDRVGVVHGDASVLAPARGDVVYLDPPYQHCPRYAATMPRPEVLRLATSWALRGARVAVSEAEPLFLEGWFASPLPSRQKPEWVTANWPLVLDRQLALVAGGHLGPQRHS